MNARHSDDAIGRLECGEIERRSRVEPCDFTARCNVPTQRVFADFGIEIADATPR